MNRWILSMSLVAGGTVASCASTPGARPSDMSETQHMSAAQNEEQAAASHLQNYRPGATEMQKHCGGPGRPCWTSSVNPTAEHYADAEKHRRMAADHRAAAQTLRDAEATACAGLSDVDRDMSPFESHREDISSVTTLTETVYPAKAAQTKIVGAVVAFRAVPGLTGEWLQRVVDCHIARNNALGNNVPEMPFCPLVPKGVSARVHSIGDGFAVEIRGSDRDSAREVLRRAETLSGP